MQSASRCVLDPRTRSNVGKIQVLKSMCHTLKERGRTLRALGLIPCFQLWPGPIAWGLGDHTKTTFLQKVSRSSDWGSSRIQFARHMAIRRPCK